MNLTIKAAALTLASTLALGGCMGSDVASTMQGLSPMIAGNSGATTPTAAAVMQAATQAEAPAVIAPQLGAVPNAAALSAMNCQDLTAALATAQGANAQGAATQAGAMASMLGSLGGMFGAQNSQAAILASQMGPANTANAQEVTAILTQLSARGC